MTQVKLRQIACAAGVVAVLMLPGCSSDPIRDIRAALQAKGEPQLQAGIRQYEEGRYVQASRHFEQALNAGLSDEGKVTAHKYLAFIHCVHRRERQCRGHFASALEVLPSFELTPAEAGHPMWGPVFRSVKSRR